MIATNSKPAEIFDTSATADLLETLTGAQCAIVSAFIQGVVAQASIAAAESEEAAEAKK